MLSYNCGWKTDILCDGILHNLVFLYRIHNMTVMFCALFIKYCGLFLTLYLAFITQICVLLNIQSGPKMRYLVKDHTGIAYSKYGIMNIERCHYDILICWTKISTAYLDKSRDKKVHYFLPNSCQCYWTWMTSKL